MTLYQPSPLPTHHNYHSHSHSSSYRSGPSLSSHNHKSRGHRLCDTCGRVETSETGRFRLCGGCLVTQYCVCISLFLSTESFLMLSVSSPRSVRRRTGGSTSFFVNTLPIKSPLPRSMPSPSVFRTNFLTKISLNTSENLLPCTPI